MKSARRRMPTRPLLAVAAFSVAACSSTGLPNGITADPAVAAANSPPAPTVSASTAAALEPAAATPRVMPDGRPACGNVTLRAPTPPDCKPR